MCYEKQASEAKQSKAKRSKYCRDVRTANQPAFHMASGLLFCFLLFSFFFWLALLLYSQKGKLKN
jgi:hypothetical protein